MNLVLFDFDGTLTMRDSFPVFLRFATSKKEFNLTLLKFFPKLVFYKIGLYNGGKLKEEVLTEFFKGTSEKKLKQLGRIFTTKVIPEILRKETIDQLLNYQKKGDQICLVSASLDLWLVPFSENIKVDCICTNLEFKEKFFTGKLSTPNCNYEQKRIRVEQRYNLSDYEKVIAFGNSKGDKSLFELADEVNKI